MEEYELIALSGASKEVEWLRNLLLYKELWSQPMVALLYIAIARQQCLRYLLKYTMTNINIGLRHECVRQLVADVIN